MAALGKIHESKSILELPKELPLNFLKDITDNFSCNRIISRNPFGTIYKGIVPEDGRVIAVKKLQENAPIPASKTFNKEVSSVMVMKHENIVEIIGFCSETHKKLVQFDKRYIQADITESFICYEYFPKTLHDYLFGIKPTEDITDWDARFKIVKGICQGLRYLHTLDIPIIHMDLNLENIWLGENTVPKIGNFALSRIFGQEQTRLCTQTVVGSYGYMAPEYLYRGEISAQTDIYSLGLMIIEIVTREKNTPDEKELSARTYIDKIQNAWTQEYIATKYIMLRADRIFEVRACIEIGLECVQFEPKVRPSIERIVDRLNGYAKGTNVC